MRFYNTLTQQVEEFIPVDGNTVRMYTCGPTVYNYVHIGNLRTFTFQDILRRWLRARGFVLNHVMNITDVEDKIIRSAMAARQDTRRSTRRSTRKRSSTIAPRCGWNGRSVWCAATEHIPEMVEAVEKLSEKGFTYSSDGSVYYRIAKFPGIRQALAQRLQRHCAPAPASMWTSTTRPTLATSCCGKRRRKASRAGKRPSGEGRPGWHIECSVMAMKYLGETLDIHAGGIDLTFPHHENEIAQSEALTGKQFARFWLHSEHLIVEGQKMSKSLGNFFTLRDLLDKGYKPEAIRYLLHRCRTARS